jgi:hypothetical protein
MYPPLAVDRAGVLIRWFVSTLAVFIWSRGGKHQRRGCVVGQRSAFGAYPLSMDIVEYRLRVSMMCRQPQWRCLPATGTLFHCGTHY